MALLTSKVIYLLQANGFVSTANWQLQILSDIARRAVPLL